MFEMPKDNLPGCFIQKNSKLSSPQNIRLYYLLTRKNNLQKVPAFQNQMAYTQNDPGDSDSDDSNSDNDSEATKANDSDAENSGENQSQTDLHQARFIEFKIKLSAKNIKSKPN